MDRRAVAREDAEHRQCLPYESQQSNKLRLLIPFLYFPPSSRNRKQSPVMFCYNSHSDSHSFCNRFC